MPQSRKKSGREKVLGKHTLHVGLSEDLKEKLDQMAAVDERDLGEFIRRLITQEWKRRQVPAEASAA